MVAIVFGVLGVLPGAVAGTLVAYGALALRMPESEGRRGLLAGVLGIVPGGVGGFIAGHALAVWLRGGGGGAWRGVIAGTIAAVLAGCVAGMVGLVVGVHLAEGRGVSNYAGERAAWGMMYVGLPAAFVVAVAAYVLARWAVG